MANRTYPRKDDEYPEIMSKMDPLIIRVSPTVLLVGATTYTAKVKLGYNFNGFMVYVSSVGIPIYKEEVDITGLNAEGTNNVGEGSDAYDYVKNKARDWMDTLEESMLKDSKEKNIVDLLREIKYQMHFDLSGHQPSSTIPDSEDYDPRIELCDEVPTYITDIYKLLADMNAKLNNLMVVMASDGTNVDKNKLITSVDVQYDSNTHGFTITPTYDTTVTKGLNKRIEDLNESIGTSKDDAQGGKSLQSRITKMQESIGNGTDADHTSLQDMIYNNTLQLTAIQSSIGPGTGSGQGGASLQAKIDAVASDIVALSTQSGTNATTISNAITNGLSQLVAQMTTMNSRIGSPDQLRPNDTLFSIAYDINTDTNNILTKPILGSDVSNNTVDRLNIVLEYLNSNTNDGGKRGTDTYIKALNLSSYNLTCWGHSNNNSTSITEALHSALQYGNVCWDYWKGTSGNDYSDRGYNNTSQNKWGIYIHCNDVGGDN